MNAKNTVTCARGRHIPYEEFMNLIDLSFGFTTPEAKFLGLLPKLYRPERRPQDDNYVVCEGNVPVAAVGSYDHEITVMGRTLPCRGIGNVAVHPDCRGRGYMKMAMEAAIDDMVRDGIALSALGGRRQRYRYFSYEKCGPCHTFSITADNLRHTYGTLESPLTVRLVTDPMDPALDTICALTNSGPLVPVRARADYLDIAQTWHAVLCAVLEGERVAGYAIVERNGFITELRVVKIEDFMPAIRALFAVIGQDTITLRLPPHETAYLSTVAAVAEGVQTGCSMSYSVLDFTRVVDAFFALKASYTAIEDGKLSLLIHGRARDERFQIVVKDGVPTVGILPDDAPVDRELSHLEAMELLFAPFSPTRDALSAPWNRWFPLPLWLWRADEV